MTLNNALLPMRSVEEKRDEVKSIVGIIETIIW